MLGSCAFSEDTVNPVLWYSFQYSNCRIVVTLQKLRGVRGDCELDGLGKSNVPYPKPMCDVRRAFLRLR